MTTTVLLLLLAPPAVADEEESDKALDLVQQAVAMIVNEGGAERVLEKAEDALEAPDPSGVDLELVEEAVALLEGEPSDEQLQAARGLLLEAAPSLVEAPVAEMATGAETGTTQVLDEFRPSRGVDSGSDVVTLLVAAGLIGAGLWLAQRWRPHHSIRQLRHAPSTPAPAGQERDRT